MVVVVVVVVVGVVGVVVVVVLVDEAAEVTRRGEQIRKEARDERHRRIVAQRATPNRRSSRTQPIRLGTGAETPRGWRILKQTG